MTNEISDSIEIFVKTAMQRKAEDLVVLNVSALTSYTDNLIICSGKSSRQVSSIGEFMKATLRDHGIKPLNTEGIREGQWVLLDYGHVIVHVFLDETREMYDLEGLWADAERIDVSEFLEEPQAQVSGGSDE